MYKRRKDFDKRKEVEDEQVMSDKRYLLSGFGFLLVIHYLIICLATGGF